MAKPLDVTDADFQKEVLESDLPVLVDFWADWCHPCRMIAPSVKEIASEQEGGKVSLIVAVSKDLHDKFTAPALIKDAAAAVGGSGGGRPDMAQAGGTNPAGIDEALAKVKAAVAG